MEIIIVIATVLISAIIFIPIGVAIRKKIAESKIQGAENEAKKILELANKEAENKKKEEIFKAKEQIIKERQELEQEIRERRGEIQKQETRIIQKEENLDKKEETLEGKCNLSEYYIHSSGSATSQKGFHAFLEKFIGWKLPEVPTYDDKDRKLYLQTIFPAMFIEQKRGWSGLLNTIPNFGVKDVKRKVIEYILNLDIIENERLKIEQKIKEIHEKE